MKSFFQVLRDIGLGCQQFAASLPHVCSWDMGLHAGSLLLLVSINLCQGLWRKSVSKNNPAVPEHEPGGIRTLIRQNRYGAFVSP